MSFTFPDFELGLRCFPWRNLQASNDATSNGAKFELVDALDREEPGGSWSCWNRFQVPHPLPAGELMKFVTDVM